MLTLDDYLPKIYLGSHLRKTGRSLKSFCEDRALCLKVPSYLGQPFKAPCTRSFPVKLSDKDSKTIGDSMEETKEYHVRYLRAIQSPVRREILRALKDGEATVDILGERTGLEEKNLTWHLSILEHGFCVEKQVRDDDVVYDLTQEGRVVDYVDK